MTHGLATIEKHKHNECKHSLQYCDICDIVYCMKCGKEWKHKTNDWIVTYNPYQSWTYTTAANTAHQHSE